ncbi:MAG: FAD binding domain-containing protein, partial [Trebonia sp.]
LAEDEIVTAITLPPGAATGSAYEKFEQPASHLPLAGVCAAVTVDNDVITSARVAVTGVAGRPFRARHSERALVSAPAAPGSIAVAAASVAEGVRPLSDQHARGPFRLHLAEVLTRRALTRALGRARRPL